MRASHTIRPVFDDPNLVSVAGLVPVLRLAEAAGLHDLLEGLSVGSPNPVAKTTAVVAGMLAGADCIDGLDLLRHGGMGRLFSGIRAPSTLGTFLRSVTHGHVQQLDAAGAGSWPGWLPGYRGCWPGVVRAGSPSSMSMTPCVRSTAMPSRAAAYGYSGVRGLNIQLATVSTPIAAPVICRARLRRGNVASAAGAGRLLAQAITTARTAGVAGQVLCRADSAYYGWAFVGTALRHHAWFSVTARMTAAVTKVIAGIDEGAWKPIRYPKAVWEPGEHPGEAALGL